MNKLDTPTAVASQVRRHHAYRLLWRWHFYAGLGCLPFVLWLSATGMIYLFKPQLEPLLEQRYAQVARPSAALPPSTLVARAIAAVPGSVLNAYQLTQSPYDAVQILVGRGKDLHRVYLDPGSGQVLYEVRENDRFMRVKLTFGYMEQPNIPKALAICRKQGWKFDIMTTSFFLSRRSLKASPNSGMPVWQDRLFIALARSAADATEYFQIPTGRVVEIGTQVTI